MLKVNRCLDLCSDAPQITPNQQLAVFVTGLFLVVNFLPKRSRISSGTFVRGCGETCSQLPGHCVSTHIWGGGGGGSCKGQRSTNTSQNNVACLESTYDMFPAPGAVTLASNVRNKSTTELLDPSPM